MKEKAQRVIPRVGLGLVIVHCFYDKLLDPNIFMIRMPFVGTKQTLLKANHLLYI